MMGLGSGNWRETLPDQLPGIAEFSRRPWAEVVSIIMLSTAGGALVAGVFLPIVGELASGKVDALPYAFWGAALWLACAGWMSRRRWLPFGWFVTVIFIISSWV